ncbi:hypothetical protein ABIG04_005647 [Bradyrhizobium japonicum]
MSWSVADLEQRIEDIEVEVIAKHRAFRLAESELNLARVRRHDLHERHRVAFAAEDALRNARAC